MIRTRDWSESPLGPPPAWPQSLRSVVGLMLGSRFPMFLAWGQDLALLYNDAYAEILGGKHPAALGSRFRDVWGEIWPDILPRIEAAMAGRATFDENLPLLMNRRGYDEQTWFTFSYSPVRDEEGNVAGMFCACRETTEVVLAARRQSEEIERQRRQFEQAPGFICTFAGPEHTFDFVNDAHRSLFGERGGVVGQTVREAFPDLEGQGFFELLDRVYATGQRHVARAARVRIRQTPRSRSRDIYIDYLFAPIVDEAGRVTGIFCEGYDVTQAHLEAVEREKAQAALRERESELQILADNLPVLVSYMDRDFRYQFVNRAYEDWFHRRREDIRGRFVRDVVGEVAYEAARPWIERALGGERVSFERAMPYPQGTRHIRVDYMPRLSGGSVEGVYALVQDVTEARRTEATVRASEEKLRLATDTAEIGLWELDLVSGILDWPWRVRRMFGVADDRPVSMADFEASLHPEDRQPVERSLVEAMDPAHRGLYAAEYRAIGLDDGVTRWISAKGRAVFDEDGRCLRLIGTAMDISRRKADEVRLFELNETLERRVAAALAERKLLADIVDETDMLVQVVDLDYCWLAINKAAAEAFARLFGVRTPVAGDRMLDMLADRPDLQAQVRGFWSRAMRGEEFTEVARFEDPGTGDGRDYELRFRKLRDEADRVIGAYQFGHDVTERLREQRRLRETEAALVQVQKMEAVGQLTGGIAHDFNNLLGAVVSGLDLIQRKADDPERVRMLARHSLDAAERGARLTGQLLAFSRAQRMEVKPVIVADLIDGMRDLLVRSLGPMVRLTFDLDGASVPVLSDPIQLEMAVLNLAINARDAMPDGGKLMISTALCEISDDPELEPGSYVELAVRDDGPGMPPEVLSRAFDPFFTTKGVGKGTGLGLSQVYGIARQAGGTARIESRLGQGTVVRLLLARSSLPVDGPDVRAAMRAEEGVVPATVLVIDDDRDLRRMLVASLDTIGYRVVEAADGPSGLDVLEREGPDLVLLDFAMPGMNGAELARIIRRRRPDLPLVFASGYADTAAIEAASGPSAAILRKPFRIEELHAVVAAALSSRPVVPSS